jgi:hypothetical protein
MVRVVEDKATERGSSFAMVSAYRNSRVCPLHSEELGFPDGPKAAQCPRGHVIHGDVAAPLNMLRKALEEERVRGRVAEAIKKALNTVTVEALEKWTKLLEHKRLPLGADQRRPMTPCGEEAMNPVGRGRLLTQKDTRGTLALQGGEGVSLWT